MPRRTRLIIGAAVAALMTPTAPAAATPPPGSVMVNPSTTGTLGDTLIPLAGAASWLVYQRSTQLVAHPTSESNGTDYNVPLSDYPPSRVVEARSAEGQVVSVTSSRVNDAGWSIAGNILVATPNDGTHVDWWNLKAGTRGSLTLSGRRAGGLVSAAPGGLLFVTGSNQLKRLNLTTNRIRSYGTPIANGITLGVAGPNGAVVSLSGERARYVPYAHPHRSVTLTTTATDGDPVQCTGVSARFASCYRLSDDDDAAAPSADILVPLTGANPAVSTNCPGYPSIAGDTIIWAASDPFYASKRCDKPAGSIVSLRHGAKHVHASTTRATNVSTSAYGKAIFPGITEDSLLAATSATHIKRVLNAPKSAVSVGAFDLSAGRISYTDDELDVNHPADVVSVRIRRLDSDGSTVTLGSSSVIGDDIDNAPTDGSLVAASGATTAYLVDAPDGSNPSLRVVGPAGTTTIPSVAPFDVTLSGNRVLFLKTGKNGQHHWRLRDLRAGTTRDLGRPLQEANGARDCVLWGNYLLSNTGSVVTRENLTTGTQKTVATVRDQIYGMAEYGDHVAVELAADITIYDVSAGTSSQVHIGRPSGLNGFPAASSAGLVYANRHGYRLHEWSGGDVAVLGFDSLWPSTSPEVEGRVLAWLDPHANLQAAPLNIPLAQPRSLGDSIAPATFTADGSSTWSTSIPYSTPLTSCTITISQGNTTVRTLDCDDAQAALGVAAVSWDGRDQNGDQVAAGTYTWTVNAAGSAGPALDAGGGARSLTGTVTVTG